MDSAPGKDIFILLGIQKIAGAEFAMLKVARGLHKAGLPVTLVLYGKGRAFVTRSDSAIPIIDLDAVNSFGAIVALIDLLKERRPAFLISALRYPNMAAIVAARIAKCGTCVIATEHTPEERGRGVKQRLSFPLTRWIYPYANTIVAVSHGIANELQQRIRKSKAVGLCVIYNPVTVDETFVPAPHPWLEQNQEPVIISIGRLIPEKNFALLIRSFAQVLTKRPCRLIILGEGRERQALTDLAHSLSLSDRVLMPGFVENVGSWLIRSTLFVSSSLVEGFGDTLVEAMRCHLPVVATDCPVGPREVLDDGRFGILVPPGDMDALVNAIDSVMLNPPDTVAPYEHSFFFTEERCVSGYMALMQELRPS